MDKDYEYIKHVNLNKQLLIIDMISLLKFSGLKMIFHQNSITSSKKAFKIFFKGKNKYHCRFVWSTASQSAKGEIDNTSLLEVFLKIIQKIASLYLKIYS